MIPCQNKTNLHCYGEIILCLWRKEHIYSFFGEWLIPLRGLTYFNYVKLQTKINSINFVENTISMMF